MIIACLLNTGVKSVLALQICVISGLYRATQASFLLARNWWYPSNFITVDSAWISLGNLNLHSRRDEFFFCLKQCLTRTVCLWLSSLDLIPLPELRYQQSVVLKDEHLGLHQDLLDWLLRRVIIMDDFSYLLITEIFTLNKWGCKIYSGRRLDCLDSLGAIDQSNQIILMSSEGHSRESTQLPEMSLYGTHIKVPFQK